MRFPNKFISYKQSTFAMFPVFLELLQKTDMTVMELYEKVKNKIANNKEFIDVLDCLYAMKKIELDGEILHYVSRD